MWDRMLTDNSRSRRSTHQKGQALVEFGIAATVFFLILFGILEFGRALWTWNTIVQATRAGARFAVVEAPTGDDAPVKKVVVYQDPNAANSSNPVAPGLTTGNVRVEYLMNDGTAAANKDVADVVQVSVTGYQFQFLIPVLGSTITLPAFTTTLPLEGMGAS
jgi:Flp pilus assembly protein TadG